MKFSEFISNYALSAYLNYCKDNNIKPTIDVSKPTAHKLCALVQPKIEITDDKTAQTRTKAESSHGKNTATD